MIDSKKFKLIAVFKIGEFLSTVSAGFSVSTTCIQYLLLRVVFIFTWYFYIQLHGWLHPSKYEYINQWKVLQDIKVL